MSTETQSPVKLTREAARIVARYRKISQGGFQTWFEIIMGCLGDVAIKDVWPLLNACGEVADQMRAEERDRLARQRLIDTVPRWQPLMAYFGRHMAEFRGDPESAQSKEAAYWMRQCAEVADEWVDRQRSAAK